MCFNTTSLSHLVLVPTAAAGSSSSQSASLLHRTVSEREEKMRMKRKTHLFNFCVLAIILRFSFLLVFAGASCWAL